MIFSERSTEWVVSGKTERVGCAFLFLHFDKTVIQAFPEQPACLFRKGRNQSSAKKRKKKECYILTCVRVCVHWVDFRGSEAVVVSCAGHLRSFWYCCGFRKATGIEDVGIMSLLDPTSCRCCTSCDECTGPQAALLTSRCCATLAKHPRGAICIHHKC